MQAETTESEGRRKSLFQERWMRITRRQFVKMLALLIFRTESSQGLKRNKKRMFAKRGKEFVWKLWRKIFSNGFSLLMTAISPHSPCFVRFLALPVVFHAPSESKWCHCGLSKLFSAFCEWKAMTAMPSGCTAENFDYIRVLEGLGRSGGDADCGPPQHFFDSDTFSDTLQPLLTASESTTVRDICLPSTFCASIPVRLSKTRYEW